MNIEVGITIYLFGEQDGRLNLRCGFVDEMRPRLPTSSLTPEQFAAEAAIALFRQYIDVDPRELDIAPLGFFDPVDYEMDISLRNTRSILLAYRTCIQPGTPIHKDLKFYASEEIEIARQRIAPAHYQAQRAGMWA